MRGASQFVKARRGQRWTGWLAGMMALVVAFAISSAAQMHGPPSTTTIGGHFLAPPASVLSGGGGRHLPPPTPSVTSIPNTGFGNRFHGRGSNHGSRSWGGGWAYSVPYYYYPMDDAAGYGYDYMGNGSPDLYSGPPIGPNEQTLHIVVEQPPARPYSREDAPDSRTYAFPPAPTVPPAPVPDAKPGEPTVLVFCDGHRQEVTNYAIMGDTVYVLDKGRKKIALADLDVPATIKANDDRGLEFKVPASPGNKKNTTLPQSVTPDQNAAPRAIASAMP